MQNLAKHCFLIEFTVLLFSCAITVLQALCGATITITVQVLPKVHQMQITATRMTYGQALAAVQADIIGGRCGRILLLAS